MRFADSLKIVGARQPQTTRPPYQMTVCICASGFINVNIKSICYLHIVKITEKQFIFYTKSALLECKNRVCSNLQTKITCSNSGQIIFALIHFLLSFLCCVFFFINSSNRCSSFFIFKYRCVLVIRKCLFKPITNILVRTFLWCGLLYYYFKIV